MITVKRLTNTAIMPEQSYPGDAGYDLFYDGPDYQLSAGDYHFFETNVAIQLPNTGDMYDMYGQIAPRSGLAFKHGLMTMAGIIDRNYIGGINVGLINMGKETITIKTGDRIAQFIPIIISRFKMVEVKELKQTERGENKYGSTERKIGTDIGSNVQRKNNIPITEKGRRR